MSKHLTTVAKKNPAFLTGRNLGADQDSRIMDYFKQHDDLWRNTLLFNFKWMDFKYNPDG